MADNLKLSVVTPEGSLFSGEATFVAAPAWDGEVGILPGHAAMIAVLGTGELRIERMGIERDESGSKTVDRYAVRGGFLQVIDDQVTLLVTEAKTADGLDVEVVKGDLEEILEALGHPESDEAYEKLLDDRRWQETLGKIS